MSRTFNPPEVSVVLPVYNRPQLGLRAVESVLAQTCCDYELIVVDDGSEKSLPCVRKMLQKERGVCLQTDNRGVAAARNFGVKQSRGRWIAFLDSDDEWEPNKLREQLEYLNLHSELRMCQTMETWIRNGHLVNPRHRHEQPDGEAFLRSLELCCISPSSVMIERRLFEASGGFDEHMRVCEDYDLWLRLTLRNRVGLVRKPLVKKYGGHADQLSKSAPAMDRFRVYALVKLMCKNAMSEREQQAVALTIRDKSRVIAAGARKRGKVRRAELFEAIGRQAEISLDGSEAELLSNWAKQLTQLLKEIQDKS